MNSKLFLRGLSAFIIVSVIPVNFVYARSQLVFRKNVITKKLGDIRSDEAGTLKVYKVYTTDNKAKIEEVGGNRYSILRMDLQNLWRVNVMRREYRELTFIRLQALSGQQDIMRSQIQPLLDFGVTTARRDFYSSTNSMQDMTRNFMRQMMEQQLQVALKNIGVPADNKQKKTNKIKKPALVTTQVTDEYETILGYKCRRVNILEDKDIVVSAWITSDIDAGRNFMTKVQYLENFQDSAANEIKKIKGFPMKLYYRIDVFLEGSDIITKRGILEQVTEISSNEVFNDSIFELPSGYKKVVSE